MNEKVFISYSSKDADWANQIKAILESNGISCWMDWAGIRAGGKYTREIMDAIRQCSIFLLVLSENAEASEWVPKELGKAIQYRKHIIPVKISDFQIREFELQLENIQVFRLRNMAEMRQRIALVNAVRTTLQLTPVNQAGYIPPQNTGNIPLQNTGNIPPQNTGNARHAVPLKLILIIAGILGALVVGIAGFLFMRKFLPAGGPGNTIRSGAVSGREQEAEEDGTEEEKKEKTSVKESRKAADDGAGSAGADSDNPDAADDAETDKESGSEEEKEKEGKAVSDKAGGQTELISLPMMSAVNAEISKKVENTAGQTVEDAVVVLGSYADNQATFYLGGDYDRFVGTVSCPDELSHTENYRFMVYLDDNESEPAVEMTMSRSTPPTLLDIEVTGCDTITFRTSREARDAGFVISEGKLYRSGEEPSDKAAVDSTVMAEDNRLVSQPLMKSVNAQVKKNVANTAGQTYEEAVMVLGSYADNQAAFYLGGNYDRFVGTVSCPDELSHAENYRFMVYLDDNESEPAVEMTMSRSTPPTLLDIEVTGCDTITFRTSREARDAGFVISEGKLYRSGEEPSNKAAVDSTVVAEDNRLVSQPLMKSVNAQVKKNVANTAGQTYEEAVMVLGSYADNQAVFYLGGNYSRFKGTVSCPDELSHAENYRFMVYLDDNEREPAVEMTMSRSTPPTPLDIDITGCNTITFCTSREARDAGFIISDGEVVP